MINSKQSASELRLLVVIASCGQKNAVFLGKIIRSYQSMAMKVDVVVVSEAPKELGPGVEVVVGLPSKNPWTLPFAHKPVFAERVERYDLFLYSEDDIEVTENQIRAFLRAAEAMQPDEIPGYLRYEITDNGTKLLTDVHGPFHWRPESVRRRGDYMIAEFTNEHAGFYILTQRQLRAAVASGGFINTPYQGRYGLPETAATDPYTNCGFRKVICISALEDFLIRHMSNLYVDRHGVLLSLFRQQVQTLMNIGNHVHPVSKLCEVETKMLHLGWSKNYYETPDETLLGMVPKHAKQILSIGCGWGAMETELKQRGSSVTALPLDSVIGATAERLGMEVIYGNMEEGFKTLGERRFDCVLVTNLFHLLPAPGDAFEECCRFVGEGGTLVASGPNFSRLPTMFRRALGVGDYCNLGDFDKSGINTCSPNFFRRHARTAGFGSVVVRWSDHAPIRPGLIEVRAQLGRFTARNWILRARR